MDSSFRLLGYFQLKLVLREVEIKYYCLLFIPGMAASEGKWVFLGRIFPLWEQHRQLLPRSFCSVRAIKQNKQIFLLMNFTNEKNKLMFYAQGSAACSMCNLMSSTSQQLSRGKGTPQHWWCLGVIWSCGSLTFFPFSQKC